MTMTMCIELSSYCNWANNSQCLWIFQQAVQTRWLPEWNQCCNFFMLGFQCLSIIHLELLTQQTSHQWSHTSKFVIQV